MADRKQPTGYVATCQCGVVVGAMDLERMDRAAAGKLLGQWIGNGCTLTPRFGGTWGCRVEVCRCSDMEPGNG